MSEEDERFKKYEIGHTFSKLDEKVFVNSKLSDTIQAKLQAIFENQVEENIELFRIITSVFDYDTDVVTYNQPLLFYFKSQLLT